MKTERPNHNEKGLLAILARPRIYDFFGSLITKRHVRDKIVQQYIRPFPGCSILDIGCGTASILSHLPNSIGEYTGFDMNPSYIEFAKNRWRERANCSFFSKKVEDAATLEKGQYDIVLAIGIVHHLSDNEAIYLFSIAYQALNPNGVLITYDNVYVENQNWFAKWFISKDRGRTVRTAEGYRRLAAQCFMDIESDILHDLLRIPYTIFIMRCIKRSIIKAPPSHSHLTSNEASRSSLRY
jgi:SAM-dependent methyltransferase